MKTLDPIIITLAQDKDTKNTVRYVEEEGDRGLILGTVYVQKWAAAQLGKPSKIRITIEATE